MYKKGNGFITAGFIFFFLLAIGILAIFLLSGNIGKTKDNIPSQSTKLLIRGLSEIENNYTDVNYSLEYNGKTYQEGFATKDAFEEVNAPINQTYSLYCWNKDFYVRRAVFPVRDAEAYDLTCSLNEKIGDLNLSVEGNLTSKLNKLKLNISTKDTFKKVVICFSWGTGIIDATLPEQNARCDGNWVNWSSYHPENGTYDYYQKEYPEGEGIYRCPSDDSVEKCKYAIGSVCRVIGTEKPLSYKSIADSCYYTGRTLKNSSEVFDIEVKMLDIRNKLDYLDIYILDQDRIKYSEDTIGGWRYFTESGGENLGNKEDYYIHIPYTGQETY